MMQVPKTILYPPGLGFSAPAPAAAQAPSVGAIPTTATPVSSTSHNRQDSLVETTTSNTAKTADDAATADTHAANLAAAHDILDELLATSQSSASLTMKRLENLTLHPSFFQPASAGAPTTVNPADVMPRGKEPAPGAGLWQEVPGLSAAPPPSSLQPLPPLMSEQEILDSLSANLNVNMDMADVGGVPVLDEPLFDEHRRFVDPGMEGLPATGQVAPLDVDATEGETGPSGAERSWEKTVGELDEEMGGFGG
ncbi:hypothetical protein CB0940_04848 [Cercospora beticola]|uniref:Uncharacterized protein n=1 Tax=Cercospora beticola TaxID=122368 RepID=A0A2G5HKV9_CERBT|nr:hypothetical protein CB0940_04848 [Cercospora beticola]PIA93168.1 hypothetical protein CB0940_04848 [Cercospora beticola]WPB02128.1 hypothetical protein RHO25_006762 [Cercospora beticola]CAK1363016.1 unnamed protein product [Cercospora beticola]